MMATAVKSFRCISAIHSYQIRRFKIVKVLQRKPSYLICHLKIDTSFPFYKRGRNLHNERFDTVRAAPSLGS